MIRSFALTYTAVTLRLMNPILSVIFDDVTQFFGQCKFNNCQHKKEPGCAIKTALDSDELDQRRWESYQKLQDEQVQRNAPRYERNTKTKR